MGKGGIDLLLESVSEAKSLVKQARDAGFSQLEAKTYAEVELANRQDLVTCFDSDFYVIHTRVSAQLALTRLLPSINSI